MFRTSSILLLGFSFPILYSPCIFVRTYSTILIGRARRCHGATKAAQTTGWGNMKPTTLATVSGLLVVLVAFPGASAQPAPTSAPPIQVNIPQPSAGMSADRSAGDDATEIAKKLQNPVGDLISVPFTNYTNFNVGPNKGTQDVLQIQPVIPIHVNPDWNVITRTVASLVWSPSFQPAASLPPFGMAPTSFTAFLSPANPIDGWVWGVGPVTQLPTISNKELGSNVWGLGPSFVVVKLAGPIVAGILVNNVFSLGGTTSRGGTHYNTFLFEPFFNYNFGGGWFVGTVPIMTANWDAGGEKWTLPVGFQAGRVIKIRGKLPVKLEVGAYYNALRPPGAGTWQLLTEVALVF
jgi:hypothetical protein